MAPPAVKAPETIDTNIRRPDGTVINYHPMDCTADNTKKFEYRQTDKSLVDGMECDIYVEVGTGMFDIAPDVITDCRLKDARVIKVKNFQTEIVYAKKGKVFNVPRDGEDWLDIPRCSSFVESSKEVVEKTWVRYDRMYNMLLKGGFIMYHGECPVLDDKPQAAKGDNMIRGEAFQYSGDGLGSDSPNWKSMK